MTPDDQTRLVTQLKADEGFKLYAYQDTLGFATIGYGRMIDRRKGGGITLGEAEYLLANDIAKTEQELSAYDWFAAQDSVRQAALTDMGFNLGVENLVLEWPHFIGFIAAKNYTGATGLARHSRWHIQVGPRGDRIIHMLETGTWV